MLFARAAKEVGCFLHVSVTESTVRRQTEAAGAAYVQVQEQAVERLVRETPPASLGPATQFLSVDGARVPLVDGEWAEAKTLAIGEVEPPVVHQGETAIQTRGMSYFARLTDSNTFQRRNISLIHARQLRKARLTVGLACGVENHHLGWSSTISREIM